MSLPALGARASAAAGAGAAACAAATPAGGASAGAGDNLFAALLAGLGDAMDAAPVNGAAALPDPCAPAACLQAADSPPGDAAAAAVLAGAVPDPMAGMALLMAQYAPAVVAPGAAVAGAVSPGAAPPSGPGAALPATASVTQALSLPEQALPPAGGGAAAAATPGADLAGTAAVAPRMDTPPPATPAALGAVAAADAPPLSAGADAQATLQALPDMGALAPGWAAPPAAVSAQGTASAAPVYQAQLPSRPGEAAFAGDLAAQVTVLVEGGFQQAQLRLNPSELGPIQIQLNVSAQTLTADISFTALHGLTRESIEQALPELREMLEAQGLSLGETGVSGGQHDQGGGRDSAAAQARPAPRPGAQTGGGGEPVPSATAGLAGAARATRGMLDLYA